jgi:peptidyl-prolyl cis-trans isomerase A (cyclophilin A)
MTRHTHFLALVVSALLVALASTGCDNKPPADAATATPPTEPAPAVGSAPATAAASAVAGDKTNTVAAADTEKPADPAEKPANEPATPPGSAPAAPVADNEAPAAEPIPPALMDPSKANEQAPEQFTVKFDTTKGEIHIAVTRKWAPRGADRFYNLVKAGWYQDIAFFRVIAGFMAQFGIHGNPEVNTIWRNARIEDDPKVESNKRGFVTFAMGGPNTRTNQIFINFSDENARLDNMGFSPFGKVVKGMEVVDALYSGYGEGAPSGAGPSQMLVQTKGNGYLKESFPKLDYIKSATILQ